MAHTRSRIAVGCWLLGGAACGGDPALVGSAEQPIVYGADDRQHYFEVSDPEAQAMVLSSAVALIPRDYIGDRAELADDTPSWELSSALCPGERFADEPAAAFCSGVLVDWDLVLTAGHCIQPYALSDFVAVLGYYSVAPGELALRESDILDVVEVVKVVREPAGSVPRLDYAWLRLGQPAAAPRAPVAVFTRGSDLVEGAAITAISAVGGTPLKLDAGARIRDARPEWTDYFIADTDTAAGSSGAPALDENLALVGVLARGGTDLVLTKAGCYTTLYADTEAAEEEFTYAERAVAGLCEEPSRSSLCRSDCGEVCRALPLRAPPARERGGCALTTRAAKESGSDRFAWVFIFCTSLSLCLAIRSRSRRLAVRH